MFVFPISSYEPRFYIMFYSENLETVYQPSCTIA
jgi:hypothetical protein